MSKLEVFLLIFPPNHLIKIIALTNVRLESKGHEYIKKGELVKFFGIIILESLYEARTGLRWGRFDAIWSCIRFS